MDLKNDQITVRELLQNPKAKALLQSRFGQWMKHPMFGAAQGLTLAQLTALAVSHVPEKTLQDTLRDLKEL